MKTVFRIYIFGFLAMALTFCISKLLIGEIDLRFWLATGPLLLSEFIIVLCTGGLIGKTKAQSFPLQITTSTLPLVYFVLSFMTSFLYWSFLSNTYYMLIQAIALIVFLLPFMLFESIKDTMDRESSILEKNIQGRTDLKNAVFKLRETFLPIFQDNGQIMTLVDQCMDNAQYDLAESVPSSKTIDAEIQQHIRKLVSETNGENPIILRDLQKLLSLFRERENIIKSSR